jgi:hypothetical protein
MLIESAQVFLFVEPIQLKSFASCMYESTFTLKSFPILYITSCFSFSRLLYLSIFYSAKPADLEMLTKVLEVTFSLRTRAEGCRKATIRKPSIVMISQCQNELWWPRNHYKCFLSRAHSTKVINFFKFYCWENSDSELIYFANFPLFLGKRVDNAFDISNCFPKHNHYYYLTTV